MSQIDEIRDKIDLVELIGSMGVALRKTGRSYVGFCPFHPNTRTPAFHVYPDNQSFHCFGCQAHGTAFDFVMRKQGLDFRDALEQLAARAGVTLEARSGEARQEDARRAKLLEINAAAARYFNYILTTLKRGEPARDYVAQRAISDAMVEQFQLGYSLDDWGHCLTYLTEKKGYAPEDVEAAGLAIRHERGNQYDRFRGRLIFPIRNAKGEVVGFGGRALGDGQPKYLNTPETLLYKKGDLLYGLDLAREAIRTEDRTVVVEGYVDVITAHQHGFRNVVAPLGTALTRNHVALLKRLSHNVFMALDADAAGQKATMRGLSALRESAGEDGRLVATAQGAVRLESDVSLRIIRMPEGRDPDEVIKADPELWRQLVADAVPVMEFYLAAYTAGLDLKNPQDQNSALERLIPLLAELDGTLQRVYISRIEQVVGIRAELIIDLLRGGPSAQGQGDKGRRGRGDKGKGRRAPEGRQPGAAEPPAPPRDDAPHPAEEAAPGQRLPAFNLQRSFESQLLGLAMRHASVDPAVEALLEKGLAAHPAMREFFGGGVEDLLEDPLNQELWRQFTTLPPEWRPNTPEDLDAWTAGLDEPFRARAAMLVEYALARPDVLRFRREAEDCAVRVRRGQIAALRGRLLDQLRDGGEPDETARLVRLIGALNSYDEALKQPRRSSTFPDLRNTIGQE